MADESYRRAIVQAESVVQAASDAYEEIRRIHDDAQRAVQETEEELARVETLLEGARHTFTDLIVQQSGSVMERCSATMRDAMRVHSEVLALRRRVGAAASPPADGSEPFSSPADAPTDEEKGQDAVQARRGGDRA